MLKGIQFERRVQKYSEKIMENGNLFIITQRNSVSVLKRGTNKLASKWKEKQRDLIKSNINV
jgi:hypothetical protein